MGNFPDDVSEVQRRNVGDDLGGEDALELFGPFQQSVKKENHLPSLDSQTTNLKNNRHTSTDFQMKL